MRANPTFIVEIHFSHGNYWKKKISKKFLRYKYITYCRLSTQMLKWGKIYFSSLGSGISPKFPLIGFQGLGKP